MNCQISSEGPLCQDTWIDLVWMRAKSHTVNLFVYLKGQLCIPGPQIFTGCNRHSHSWCVYVSVCVSDIESVMVHATDSQANLWLWPARAHTYKVCPHARGVSACIWACVLLTSWIRMNNDYHILKFCSLTDFWSIFTYFDHWLLQKDTTKKLFVSACACMSLRNVISWKKKTLLLQNWNDECTNNKHTPSHGNWHKETSICPHYMHILLNTLLGHQLRPWWVKSWLILTANHSWYKIVMENNNLGENTPFT